MSSFAKIGILCFAVVSCDPGKSSRGDGPCDREHACEVSGIDLEVVSVRFLQPIGHDSVSGFDIVPHGSAPVEYSIRNRGDSTSASATAKVWQTLAEVIATPLPPLAPGAVYTDTVVLGTRQFNGSGGNFTRSYADFIYSNPGFPPSRGDDVLGPQTSVLADGDTTAANDLLIGPNVHVAVPIVSGAIEHTGGAELRVNRPFIVAYDIRNVSLHGGTLPAGRLVVCMWQGGLPCNASRWSRTMPGVEVPAIPAGGRLAGSAEFTLAAFNAMQDRAGDYDFTLCWLPRDDNYGYLEYNEGSRCFGRIHPGHDIRVVPDYAACAPPPLIVEQVITLHANNCGQRPLPKSGNLTGTFFLFTLDAAAGRTYMLDPAVPASAVRVFDAEGRQLTGLGPFAAAQRVYVAIALVPPITLTIR